MEMENIKQPEPKAVKIIVNGQLTRQGKKIMYQEKIKRNTNGSTK